MAPEPPAADDRRAVLALGLVAASALVFWPGAFDPFGWPKVLVAAAGVAVAATVTPTGRLPRPLVLVVLGGIAVVVLSALVHGTPGSSLLGRFPRYEGVPVLALYAACAWTGARLLGGSGIRRLPRLHDVLAVVGLLVALSVVLEAVGLGITPATDSTRTGVVVGNATDQGIVGMLLLAVLVGPAVVERRPVVLAGAASAVVVLGASGSRAALLAAVVVVALQAVSVQAVSGQTRARAGLVGALGAVVAVSLLLPVSRDRLLSSDTVVGRQVLWTDSWRLVRDHLLLGVGPSRYVDAIGAEHGDRWVREVGVAAPPDSPHSWPLQALAVGGVPLLLLAVALAVLVGRAAWRAARTGDVARLGSSGAVVGFGLVLMTHFTAPATTCLAMLLVGALLAVPAGEARERDPALGRGVAVVAGVGVVAAACFTLADVRVADGVEAAADGRTVEASAAFDAAYRWRLHDGDVAMLASQSLAGAVSAGDGAAVDPTITWARRSLARTPGTQAAGLALGVALVARGDLPQAERVLGRLEDRFPTDPQVRIQLAIARFGQGDLPAALAGLHVAERLDPEDPTPSRLREEMIARAG